MARKPEKDKDIDIKVLEEKVYGNQKQTNIQLKALEKLVTSKKESDSSQKRMIITAIGLAIALLSFIGYENIKKTIIETVQEKVKETAKSVIEPLAKEVIENLTNELEEEGKKGIADVLKNLKEEQQVINEAAKEKDVIKDKEVIKEKGVPIIPEETRLN
ncbi:MAG: hypothetical protein ACE5KZ_10400 [Candidatus Scalinduaceae bacterium]